MQLALKVDVPTLSGVLERVPRLVEILERHRAGATFFCSLGRDRRWWQPSTRSARRAKGLLRGLADAGFETGMTAHDNAAWQRRIVTADADWIEAQMRRSVELHSEVFGDVPLTHAAAGWRCNAHALRMTQRLGFDYASDGRGSCPHLPVWNAELVRCPQFPTTLPTLDELLHTDGVTPDNVALQLLQATSEGVSNAVFAYSADGLGARLDSVLEQLLIGWTAQGYRLVRLRDVYASVEPLALERCDVGWGKVPGCAHMLLVQKGPFLAEQPMRSAAANAALES